MSLSNCHNFQDFRTLAKRRLPGPIFHYIDGAADDEITYRRNTSPEIIQLAVKLYARFPLSLRSVEDLLHKRGVDVSYEAILYWWHRFGFKFASEIKKFIFVAKDRFWDRFSKMAPH